MCLEIYGAESVKVDSWRNVECICNKELYKKWKKMTAKKKTASAIQEIGRVLNVDGDTCYLDK